MREGIRIFCFALLAVFRSVLGQKTVVFQFKCVLQLADFLFFSICLLVFINITSEFLDLVSDVVFGFSYLGSCFSSILAAIMHLH